MNKLVNLLAIIVLITIGSLVFIEGWKLHIVVSVVGFCLIVVGYVLADKYDITPKKLIGRTFVFFVIIGIIFIIIGMLFPNFQSENLNSIYLEITLGYVSILLVGVFYSILSEAWTGR